MVLKSVLLLLASPIKTTSNLNNMVQLDDFEMYGDNMSRSNDISFL